MIIKNIYSSIIYIEKLILNNEVTKRFELKAFTEFLSVNLALGKINLHAYLSFDITKGKICEPSTTPMERNYSGVQMGVDLFFKALNDPRSFDYYIAVQMPYNSIQSFYNPPSP